MPMSPETRERFEGEQRAYWRQRDRLLREYPGRWVAMVGGEVVAVGERSGDVIREAMRKTGSTVGYVARVGQERQVYRIRAVAGYFDSGFHHSLPMVTARLEHAGGAPSTTAEFIVDTGADLTVLTTGAADEVDLWDSAWRTAEIAPIGRGPETRPLYAATVSLAEHGVPVEVDCRDDIDSPILGRDVINEFALTVRAKREQVEFEWVED